MGAAHPTRSVLRPRHNQESSRHHHRQRCDPIYVDDITPEIVAARVAHGLPLHPNLIRMAQESGKSWPRPEVAADTDLPSSADAASDPIDSPPNEDFSALNDESPLEDQEADALPAKTSTSATACGESTAPPAEASSLDSAPSQPLLTSPNPLPVTAVQVTPNAPSALLTPSAPPSLSPVP